MPEAGQAWGESNAAAGAGVPATQPQPQTPKPVLPSSYFQLAHDLDLDAAQRDMIAEKVADRTAALRVWDAQHQSRMDELARLMAQARQSADKQTLSVHAREHTALRAERAALGRRYEEAMIKALPPQKQALWYGYEAYAMQTRGFRNLDLSEAQAAQIKERFLTAGTQLQEAATYHQRATIAAQIREQVEAEVLTEAQRADLAGERSGVKRPKPAKPAKSVPVVPPASSGQHPPG
jgi:hypothetical protein